MAFGGIFGGRVRRRRGETVRDLATALNSLDYDAAKRLVTKDFVMIDHLGRTLEGYGRFAEGDCAFREQTGRPQMSIESLDHIDDEVLVRGYIESDMVEVKGPALWQVWFRKNRIERIEVTRPAGLMTSPSFALKHQQYWRSA